MSSGGANNDSIEAEDLFASNQEESKQAEPAPAEDAEDPLDDEILAMSTTELRQRIRLLDSDIRIMRSDIQRITHESHAQRERIRDNVEKVKMNKQLPYLVGNVVEVLEPDAEDGTNIVRCYLFLVIFWIININLCFY